MKGGHGGAWVVPGLWEILGSFGHVPEQSGRLANAFYRGCVSISRYDDAQPKDEHAIKPLLGT